MSGVASFSGLVSRSHEEHEGHEDVGVYEHFFVSFVFSLSS